MDYEEKAMEIMRNHVWKKCDKIDVNGIVYINDYDIKELIKRILEENKNGK